MFLARCHTEPAIFSFCKLWQLYTGCKRMQWKICYAETNHFCGYQDSLVNEFLNGIFDTARNTRLGVFAEPRIACWIFCHLKVTLRQASTNHVHKNEKRFER